MSAVELKADGQPTFSRHTYVGSTWGRHLEGGRERESKVERERDRDLDGFEYIRHTMEICNIQYSRSKSNILVSTKIATYYSSVLLLSDYHCRGRCTEPKFVLHTTFYVHVSLVVFMCCLFCSSVIFHDFVVCYLSFVPN